MSAAEDRNGKFIAVANMKGGVGKTTTVVSLAEALAADDATKKILVIDLDPQASASVAIAGDDALSEMIDEGRTFENFLDHRLIRRTPGIDIAGVIASALCTTSHRNRQLAVSLLPCGPKLRSVERDLIYALGRANSAGSIDAHIAQFFKTDVLPLARNFDFILFDCAPGISPVTEAAVRLSDLVLVPTVPDRLSVYGLNAFYESLWMAGPPPKSVPNVLVVRMDKGIRQHKDVLESLQEGGAEPDAGYRLMEAQIPTSAALVEALMKNGELTLVEKYTPQVIAGILIPLMKEVKELL